MSGWLKTKSMNSLTSILLLVLTSLLFNLKTFSQTQKTSNAKEKVVIPEFDLSGPRSSFRYFLRTMKAHKLGDRAAIDLAVKTLNLSSLDPTTKETYGRLAARHLVGTIDRLEYIDFKNIPQTVQGKSWTYKKSTVEWEGENYEVEITLTQNKKGEWKFSPATVSSVFYYYNSLKNQKVVEGVKELKDWKERVKSRMPKWTGQRHFILLNGQWIGLFLIIFCAIFFRFFLKVYVGHLLLRVFRSQNIIPDERLKKSLSFPISLTTLSGIWTLGVRLLEFNDRVLGLLLRIGYIGFTVGAVLCIYVLVDILKIYLEKMAAESENKFDDILVPLVTKTMKTFVVLIGIIFIGNSLTLDMKSIIAGMGIGGIAFALAAKDTIGNIFGSLTVLLDRPFRIGDWVKIDGSIEGTVEEVGLRSTRIRTFYDSQITLPNGKLTNAHIDNYGQRNYRRLSTKLGVEYSTPPEKVEAFCEGIRQLIHAHPYTRKDSFHVYFNSFGDSALEILLYVFWRVPDWSTELNEKHRLLMDILRLGNSMGVNFAFPTQTLHLFNESHSLEQTEEALLIDEQVQKTKELAQELSNKTLTPSKARSNSTSLLKE